MQDKLEPDELNMSGIVTEKHWESLDTQNMLQNYGPRNLTLARGEGSWLWDEEGNPYLDAMSGIAVMALGHGHPKVTQAMKSQIDQLVHCSNLYLTSSSQTLAEKLVETTHLSKVFFCNSGTEANEAMFKYVRKYWYEKKEEERVEIVTVSPSFHGRTYGALAATGQESIQKGFGPLPDGYVHIPVNDVVALKKAISDKTAAILVEPILAEGGVIDLTPEFVSALQGIQSQGILLLCDEIQTGIGRTGKLWGYQTVGLIPDAISLAKPLGGGLPLGAVLMSEDIATSIKAGDHGTTFGGNPVSCAAGNAILDEVSSPAFLEQVRSKSDMLRQALIDCIQQFPDCGLEPKTTGSGFLIGIPCSKNLGELLIAFREEGLLVLKAGSKVLRLLPALNITEEDLQELLVRFKKGLVRVTKA
jgi:predicted acetylornithine/succinylornithine family transaminase